jgi:hypothetical protein
MGLCCLLLELFSYDRGLPMAAAVTAAAMSAATTVEAATAANRAAVESTADCAASREAGTATSESATVIPAPAPTRTSVEAAVEPRARADEDSTGEVARTIVSVRRAVIRVIPIVSVGADRSRADVPRTDADANGNALSIGVRR